MKNSGYLAIPTYSGVASKGITSFYVLSIKIFLWNANKKSPISGEFSSLIQGLSKNLNDSQKIVYNKPKDKPDFIACDLSKESLHFAKEFANDNFHDLTKLIDLQYYPDTFQKLLKSNTGNQDKPRLITMFNMLANFDKKEFMEILTNIHDSMKTGDAFIPTFFQKEDRYDKHFHSKIFGDCSFRLLSMALYDNPETKDRIISSFCKRYKVPREKVHFDVQRGSDDREFIEVSLLISPDAVLHIPQERGKDKKLTGLEKLTAFRSYRMSKNQIEKCCEEVGFKIDGWMDSGDNIQIAPVLYK